MTNINKTFEKMYYWETNCDDAEFFTFVEKAFLKEKKYNGNIEKYMSEYMEWFDKLTEDKKSKLINQFNSK